MSDHPYAAFKLSEESRSSLLQAFPPQYPDVKLDHITIQYPCDDEGALFEPQNIEVIGHANDGQGLEALLVLIDGQTFRDDGNPWHITLSLDTGKSAPSELSPNQKDSAPYSAVMSNALLRCGLNPDNENYQITYLSSPLSIKARPEITYPPTQTDNQPDFSPS
jgi:hypothetical protein